MKPAPFEYHAPSSAKEVTALLAELGEDAKVIAGGQSLVPLLAMRLAAIGHLIDLRNVAGLRGIEPRDESVWIGAATTQAAIGHSGLVAAAVPLLALATPLIGHFQIRNRGTIGGSLAHADPAAEYPAVAVALGAVIETVSPHGQRAIPATEFFTGIWTTALAPDELITGVTFPAWDGGARAGGGRGRCGFAVREFARRPGDFAIAGAAVAVQLDENGSRVSRCGIGLLGLGPTPLRAAVADALAGTATADACTQARATQIGRAAMAELDGVPSDLHGSAGYRKRVGAAMVADAWMRAMGEASTTGDPGNRSDLEAGND